MLLGKLDLCVQKTENRFMPFTLYKYKNFNMKPETLKAVQKRVRNTLEHIDIGSNFSDSETQRKD
jgi:hypothetical protein